MVPAMRIFVLGLLFPLAFRRGSNCPEHSPLRLPFGTLCSLQSPPSEPFSPQGPGAFQGLQKCPKGWEEKKKKLLATQGTKNKLYLKLKLNNYKISHFAGKSTATELGWDWHL